MLAFVLSGSDFANGETRFFPFRDFDIGEATQLSDPTWEHPTPTIGDTGTIHLWMRTSTQVAGISLDLVSDLPVSDFPSIAFSDLVIPNYVTLGGPRWLFTLPPIEAERELRQIEMASLPGFGGVGVGPNTASGDPGYDASLDAFHLGSLSYQILNSGGATLKLRMGRNIVGFSNSGDAPSIYFGPGDQPVTNLPGSGDTTPDGRILIGLALVPHAPEPSSAGLLAILCGWLLLGRTNRARRQT